MVSVAINGRVKKGIKKLKNRNVFIDYSQINHDVFKYLEDYNPTKRMRV